MPQSLQRYVESDVLRRFYATLNSSIVDPDLFATHLIQNGFVTRQIAENKMPLGVSDYHKVQNLLGVVDAHIETAGSEDVMRRFHIFLSILGNVFGLHDIAGQMASQCCMFNASLVAMSNIIK